MIKKLIFIIIILFKFVNFSFAKKSFKKILSVNGYQIIKEIDFSWNPFITSVVPAHKWGLWGFSSFKMLSFDIIGISSESLIKSKLFSLNPRVAMHFTNVPDKFNLHSTKRLGVSFGIKSYFKFWQMYQPFLSIALLLEGTFGNDNFVQGFNFGAVFSTGLKFQLTRLFYLAPIFQFFVLKNSPNPFYFTAGLNLGFRL